MQDIVIGKERFSVSEMIGKGGEGEVYAIRGRSGLAVKIYNAGIRAKREDKVRAMIGGGLAVKTDIIAYPDEIVSDMSGNFLGFAMRLVSGYRPVHELYSPKSRQYHFPKADYRFIVRAAQNVARAVGNVHQTGCVIGDLNHSGMLVAQDARVALIDADSFQFQLNDRSYPCVVGVPDFTPPELHGKNLGTVERTMEHDNFGLAVAIFHLLFMGRHPFAGRYKGPDISMGEAIAQNRFAFSLTRRSATQTIPPPGALTLEFFSNSVGAAFEEAFGINPRARPSASDWVGALTKLEGSLNRCSSAKTHYYPGNSKDCVWCKLADSNGFDMFPDLSAVTPIISTDKSGTDQAIREILAFRFPTVGDLLPQLAATPKISTALSEARRGKWGRALLGLIMIGGALPGFVYASPVWFIWIGLAIWGWTFVADRKVATDPFLKTFKDADERVQRELKTFIRRNGLVEVVKVRSDLDAAIASYRGLDDALRRALAAMKSNREFRQRQAYLDRFSIRRANVSGIGPAKTSTLISFGIETAADVNWSSILNVPGFGDVTTRKLMDWREKHEVRFKYDRRPNALDVADERVLRGSFNTEKVKLESILRNGLGTMRNAKVRLDALPVKARSDRALLQALEAQTLAEQDLKSLEAAIPASTVTLWETPPPQFSPQPPQFSPPQPSPPKLPRLPQVSPPPRVPRATAPIQTRSTGASALPDCPNCGKPMVKRMARKGRNVGNQFWGCSGFPRCKGTISLTSKSKYNP